MGAEELEQQCIVGFDTCLWKTMTAMVELDETRMCNLLGNELTQLPRNEEIIRGSNQQRRVSDTPQPHPDTELLQLATNSMKRGPPMTLPGCAWISYMTTTERVSPKCPPPCELSHATSISFPKSGCGLRGASHRG